MWADLKLLWSLWKGRRDNPLLAYYDPRRRNVAGWAFRLGEFFCFVSMAYLGMAIWTRSGGDFQNLVDTIMFVGISAAVLLPTLFLFVAPGPWSKERCIDLRLTPLSPQEIAFGFLFWPMMLLLIVGLGCGFVLVARTADFFRWSVPTAAFKSMVLMIVGLLISLAVGATTLERWYQNSAWRWTALIISPFRVLAALVLLRYAVKLRDGWISETWIAVLLLLIAGLCTMAWLKQALTGAGWRILGVAACAEDLLRFHWPSRERTLRQLPGKGLKARWEFLRQAWPSIVLFNLVVVATTLLIGWGAHRMAYAARSADDFILMGIVQKDHISVFTRQFGLLCLPLATAVACGIASMRWVGRIPIMSGGGFYGTLAYCAPAFLGLLMPLMVLTSIPYPDPLRDPRFWMLTAFEAMGLGLILVFCFSLLLTEHRRFLVVDALVGFSLFAAGKLGVLFVQGRFLSQNADILLFVFVVVTYLFIEWPLARVYRLELRDVPLGRLNTDSYEGEPLAPEALLDELAAKG